MLLVTNTLRLAHGRRTERRRRQRSVPEHSIAVLPFVNMSERQGARVFLRRHLGGTAEPAREDSAVAGDGAHVVVFVQGQGSRDSRDRAHAARCQRARRLGAQVRQRGADHGAVDHAPAPTRTCGRRPTTASSTTSSRSRTRSRPTWSSSSRSRCSARRRTVRSTDPEAYALYLQARQLGRQGTAEAYKQSEALNRKVLAIDPRYVPAWSNLAVDLLNQTGQGLLPVKEGYAQAREAAMKALAIDPEYAPAHTTLGTISTYVDNDLSRRGAALRACAGARSGVSASARQQRHTTRQSRSRGPGVGARRGRRTPRSGERHGARQPGRLPAHDRPFRRGDHDVPHRAEPCPGPGRPRTPISALRCC